MTQPVHDVLTPLAEVIYLPESKSIACIYTRNLSQRAKKVVSDSPGLVDFAIGLVIFVLLNLPQGQVLYFGGIQITEGL